MKTFRRDTSSAPVLTLKTVALVAAISASSVALAAEHGEQRYAPGMGGSDMSSPVAPGWYGQVAMVAYHASKLKGNDGGDVYKTASVSKAAITAGITAKLMSLGMDQATAAATANGAANGIFAQPSAGAVNGGIPVRFKTDLTTDIVTILPRITYISSEKVLGGNLGFTAMIPLMREKAKLGASNPTLPAGFQTVARGVLGASNGDELVSTIQSNVAAGVAAEGGSQVGIGDLEMAPVVHWEIGDHQSLSAAATIIIPTGDYNADRLVNTGFGNFYTFRPSVQYAYIGDGWDLSGRAVLSFNTRNKDTQYKTGNILNIDFAAMKFVSDDIRVGLQGYLVRQLTADSQDASVAANRISTDDLTTGNKMQAYAAGPAVAWLKNGGEFLLEGKFLQEFGAKNRTEGQTFWLTLSKPL
jgi:hypothetical protein